jgi:hypothetical protein
VAYFFADEDGEEGAVDIAELRYWDVALSGVHVNQLGAVEYARADVNRDGVVDSADIVAVIKEMPDGDMKADVNGDTVVNSQDRDAILYIANNVYSYNNVNNDYANDAADLNNDGQVTMADWNIANAQLNAPILTNQKFLTYCTLTSYSNTHCQYY